MVDANADVLGAYREEDSKGEAGTILKAQEGELGKS